MVHKFIFAIIIRGYCAQSSGNNESDFAIINFLTVKCVEVNLFNPFIPGRIQFWSNQILNLFPSTTDYNFHLGLNFQTHLLSEIAAHAHAPEINVTSNGRSFKLPN